jgi:hypothetical protein
MLMLRRDTITDAQQRLLLVGLQAPLPFCLTAISPCTVRARSYLPLMQSIGPGAGQH